MEDDKKCIVKNCTNLSSQGPFEGELCVPCHEHITTGRGYYSQAYKNATDYNELNEIQSHIYNVRQYLTKKSEIARNSPSESLIQPIPLSDMVIIDAMEEELGRAMQKLEHFRP